MVAPSSLPQLYNHGMHRGFEAPIGVDVLL